ncbi:hypothetical protein SEUCBS139899_001882 [Sporothrix eucalyptigena]|uniref:C2H2-type domain-containing protein n=1 Tax=Sporothrix eucalyptigena TaxID=1812306 RepID=A0ABP0BZW8_9PEZI
MSESHPHLPKQQQQQQPQQNAGPTAAPTPAAYKRASRKGAPRRYGCRFPGCDKVYSRQEHLQRHQLNHNPREIFACDIDDCGQRFVRADLLARHKKRHSGSYIPRNRMPSFAEPDPDQMAYSTGTVGILSPPTGLRNSIAAKSTPRSSGLGGTPSHSSVGTSTAQTSPGLGGGGSGNNTNVGGTSSSGAGASGSSVAGAAASFNNRLPSFPHTSSSVPRDAAILLSPETNATLPATASIPVLPPHVGISGISGHRSGLASVAQPAPQVQLQTVHPTWAATARLTNIGADMMQTDKTASFYQTQAAHQQPQQQHQQQHQQHQQQQQSQPESHHAFQQSHQQQQHAYHVPPPAREDSHAMIAETAPMLDFTTVPYPSNDIERDSNFAWWLFNSQAPFGDFSMAGLPFMEGGLESPFNNNITYDYESLTSRSHIDTPPRQFENSDETISEARRLEIVRLFKRFRQQQPQVEGRIPNLGHCVGEDIPALSTEMIHDCLYEFWEHVSPRVPIVHQPTFSCNRCPPLLLVVILALGAASRNNRAQNGNLSELSGFADIVILSARFELLITDDALPPVSLWVAQSLLLLEFYEKMLSSRRLHERSHIYHSVTLTVLRRGSPLIGRSGSESPPDESQLPSLSTASPPSLPHPHSPPTPMSSQSIGGRPQNEQAGHHSHRDGHSSTDLQTWWNRWADTEAMHRVVFVAFCIDTIHAAMFGHDADMEPHEIRLPLPCDDNLWTAAKPEDVRQLDNNLRMYGVRPITFLDGLKRAVHGKEVRTHSFGRMIIMSGLLSVGWHLRHRERHLKWLDLSAAPPPTESALDAAWRKTLLMAFDGWKESFDLVQGGGTADGKVNSSGANGGNGSAGSSNAGGSTGAGGPTRRSGFNGPIESAAVLYHLAHICLHIDIIDCQVYAGARRLLGRKISSNDYINIGNRMKVWAKQASTRHAIFHAFQLLYRVLVDPRVRGGGNVFTPTTNAEMQTYSIKTEADPHRPWIMYYAALSIWSFVQALNVGGRGPMSKSGSTSRPRAQQQSTSVPRGSSSRVVAYLGHVAGRHELDEVAAATELADGLPDLLEYLQAVFAESHSELLQEARVRLKTCLEIMGGA